VRQLWHRTHRSGSAIAERSITPAAQGLNSTLAVVLHFRLAARQRPVFSQPFNRPPDEWIDAEQGIENGNH